MHSVIFVNEKKTKENKKIQNENDNNADNSSLKAALRRLADCTPETRMPVFRFRAYDDDNDEDDNHE